MKRRATWEVRSKDSQSKLLFVVFPTGLELKLRKETYFIELGDEVIKKILDKLCESATITVE